MRKAVRLSLPLPATAICRASRGFGRWNSSVCPSVMSSFMLVSLMWLARLRVCFVCMVGILLVGVKQFLKHPVYSALGGPVAVEPQGRQRGVRLVGVDS